MSIINKSNVKSNFETGDIPTQANFVDLIDSFTVPLVQSVITSAGNVSTDVSTADIFQITATSAINLDKPTNGIDGKAITYYLTQSNVGSNTITLDPSFVIPSSATLPLAFSTTVGKTDILAAKYVASADKYIVISLVPGYSL